MQIDVMTLIITLIIGHVIVCILFVADFSEQERNDYDRVFIIGKVAQLLGWCLISQRGTLPDILSLQAANMLMISGHACEAFALTSLKSLQMRRWSLIYGALTMTGWFFLLSNIVAERHSLAIGMMIVSLFYLFPGAYLCFASEQKARLQKLVGAMCILIFLAGLWRVAYLSSLLQYELSAPASAQTLLLLLRVVMLFSGSLGYILIKKEYATREISRIANIDFLTGLYNRRAFYDKAEAVFAELREKGGSLACLMIDIDFFKSINDRYGHQIGDEVIKAIADIAGRQCNDYGIVGRFGGEEFAVLMPGQDLDGAARLAEELRKAVFEHEAYVVKDTKVSISVGVAAFDAGQLMRHNLDELVGLSDRELYKAKAAGRNTVKADAKESYGDICDFA